MMPNTLRDSSPGATQPQNVPNNPMNNNPSGPYEPTGISPANSLRRIPRENRGSSGSLNELGMHPQDLAAVGAAREKDRPSSRDRERKNTITTDKPEVRKASGGGGGPPNGSAPIRPSPYGFDSTGTLKANHSTTDLLSFGNLRDSPSFDNSALASLDPLKNDPSGGSGGGVGATASIPRKQGSGDSHELPKGEHGGWHTYDGPDPSASAQKGDSRNGEWDRKQANQAYTASRFSPDRFPLTEEQDGRDEEILSVPRTVNQQPKATQPVSPIGPLIRACFVLCEFFLFPVLPLTISPSRPPINSLRNPAVEIFPVSRHNRKTPRLYTPVTIRLLGLPRSSPFQKPTTPKWLGPNGPVVPPPLSQESL